MAANTLMPIWNTGRNWECRKVSHPGLVRLALNPCGLSGIGWVWIPNKLNFFSFLSNSIQSMCIGNNRTSPKVSFECGIFFSVSWVFHVKMNWALNIMRPFWLLCTHLFILNCKSIFVDSLFLALYLTRYIFFYKDYTLYEAPHSNLKKLARVAS
jgi:hypothetical protein